jgi:hypothetical protein
VSQDLPQQPNLEGQPDVVPLPVIPSTADLAPFFAFLPALLGLSTKECITNCIEISDIFPSQPSYSIRPPALVSLPPNIMSARAEFILDLHEAVVFGNALSTAD